MTDLKFELLGILYENPLHNENRHTLLHLHPDLTCQIEDALKSLKSQELIESPPDESSYKLTNKGHEVYEQELIARKNAEEERKYRSFNKKQLIIVAVFTGITAVATVISVIVSFIYR